MGLQGRKPSDRPGYHAKHHRLLRSDYPACESRRPHLLFWLQPRGVFDTVAALGSVAQSVKFTAIYAAVAAVAAWLISLLPNVPVIGPYLEFLEFRWVYLALVAVPVMAALAIFIWTHTKFDFNVPGYSLEELRQTFHFTTEWKHTFYDMDLNINIPYAKHAISIDETRADLALVRWSV